MVDDDGQERVGAVCDQLLEISSGFFLGHLEVEPFVYFQSGILRVYPDVWYVRGLHQLEQVQDKSRIASQDRIRSETVTAEFIVVGGV